MPKKKTKIVTSLLTQQTYTPLLSFIYFCFSLFLTIFTSILCTLYKKRIHSKRYCIKITSISLHFYFVLFFNNRLIEEKIKEERSIFLYNNKSFEII